MKKQYTFEEYEKEKKLAVYLVPFFITIFVIGLLLGFVLNNIGVGLLGLPFFVFALGLSEEIDPRTKYIMFAEKEFVRVDWYFLEEFKKISLSGKLFKKNYEGDRGYEFMYIDDLGVIHHKKIKPSAAITLFKNIDEEKVVIYEKRFCDERFNKEFPLIKVERRYEIYIELENYIQIG